ncbi:OmpA family protein [Bdellovibrio svalbardensis]|uniref:OmpA family protein n=1 Tax=Bdellovibrio svalbardensis TaxID=2972972 RepID=A0ABT6DGM9_9BACT|nr:OmpA family protein [Bdellovibrio svalbardensis]MDG0816011.1 OmpA family protein [Bdellovibrio svalbardensis]
MFSRQIPAILVLAFATGFIGCASTPPTVTPISSTANPATEIQRTQAMINEARERQIDVLSPTNFNKAEDALKKAISKKEAGKSSEDVLEQLAYAQSWLRDGVNKSQLATMQMPEIEDARRGALNARANELLPKEWAKTGKQLEAATKALEKGSLKTVDKKGADIVAEYRKLERDAVAKAVLGRADENIKFAEKDKAEKIAPRTYNAATMRYDNARKIIDANPRNTEVINQAAADATRESMHLLEVTSKVKAGNTEELVLQAERQQRAIVNLKKENNAAESELNEMARQQQELARSQALVTQAASIRRQFKPNEAEVFTQNGRVMVRLKAIQFPPNQATLGPKNQAMMKKVNEAIEQVGPAKVIVQGHTDSTGNPNRNMTLSEQRAKSVQDYLVANGAVTLDNVESVGVGSAKPVSDNKTASGRAKNRRIDIIVEPLSPR